MNAQQLLDYVVTPTLQKIELDSTSARQLIIGTIWQESKGEYLHQLNDGPACGFIQMEPATHRDIWVNYLNFKDELRQKIQGLLTNSESISEPDGVGVGAGQIDHVCDHSLTWNLAYQIAMCRAHYLRVSEPLPQSGDIESMAQYWKDHYNTHLGAGSPEEFIQNFPREIL